MHHRRFNVRVYGIWIYEGRLLVNEELIQGKLVTKLPGGGLEWGEGTVDCLIREWKEELDLDIKIIEHFYTTDFFQVSAFDESQVISIYYKVEALAVPVKINNLVEQERTYWVDLPDVTGEIFTLPIDKRVGEKLSLLYSNKSL